MDTPKSAEVSFKSAGSVTALDIGREDACPADFRRLKDVTKETLLSIFGKGRLYKKGRSLAREGYLSEFPINVRFDDDGTVVVTGCCWASQKKNVKYKLFLALDIASAECTVVHSHCGCPAGLEKCVHISALMHYIAAKAAFWRALDGEEDAAPVGNAWKNPAGVSCTSLPRQWGIPSRRTIEPQQPVEELNFQRVSSQKAFEPTSSKSCKERLQHSPQCDVIIDDLELLRNTLLSLGHHKDTMSLLRYFTAADDNDVADDTETVGMLSEEAEVRTQHYDHLRPRPLQFPPYLSDALSTIVQDVLPPSPRQIEEWSTLFIHALGNIDREEVCLMTAEQSNSPRWYTERVCRLTASKFGLIAKRREGYMATLVDQLLYSAPPTTAGPLKFGQDNEPIAVSLYEEHMRSKGHLVDVQQTGLQIHQTIPFLAASPDRLVNDPSCEPSAGLLEVKCMPSISSQPESHVGKKKGFCLVEDGKSAGLSERHSYFYQIQGQLACTGRSWCDFAIMSRSQDLYVERVWFNDNFWQPVCRRLVRFFKQFLVRELIYPASRGGARTFGSSSSQSSSSTTTEARFVKAQPRKRKCENSDTSTFQVSF